MPQWGWPMTQDPRSIYTQLLQERRTAIAMREKRHQLFGYFRLGAVAAGVAMVWMALVQQSFSILWASIPLAVFIGLIVLQEHLLRRLDRHRRAVRYFRKGAGAVGWQLAWDRRDRRTLYRPGPLLCAGSGLVRQRLAFRVAFHGALAHRRGHPGALAAGAGGRRSDSRPAAGGE